MNEHDIDWSKAPEGATHYDTYDCDWIKLSPASDWFNYIDGNWVECEPSDKWIENNFIEKPNLLLKVTLEDILKIINSNKYVQFWLCNGNYHAKIGSNLDHSGDILVGEEAITEAIMGEVRAILKYTALEKQLEETINKVEEIKRKMEELK